MYQEHLATMRRELCRALELFVENEGARLERCAEWCAACLRNGGKLLLFGNGGSAAQAQHIAAEFVNRYRLDRRALAAVALTADSAVLTSIANDNDFAAVFSRQLEALAGDPDLAIALSTSGSSPNVVHGLRTARRLGLRTVALLGGEGGAARSEAELVIRVGDHGTPRIQEVQLFAAHWLCDRVEHLLEPS